MNLLILHPFSGLLHIPTMSEGHFVLYRNYKASQVTTYNPTIVQAIRLVWTTPSLFPLLENEPRIPQEYFLDVVNASNGFSNPILEVLKEVHGVFGPNATVSCLLSLGAGRAPLLSMVTTGSIAPKSLEQLAIDSERTASEVERRIGRIGVYFRLSVDRGLELDDLSKSMSRIVAHTRQYLLDEDVNKTLDSCIRSSEMESHITLNQLCEHFQYVFILISHSCKIMHEQRVRHFCTTYLLSLLSSSRGQSLWML